MSNYKLIGASNHTDKERQQDDYYATDPIAIKKLLELEDFTGPIWECACGEGHLSKELIEKGYEVLSTDLIDRGHGHQLDFLNNDIATTNHNIITNPPYKYANEFLLKSLSIMEDDKKLCLFLPIRYLEGKSRRKIFDEYPPETIYVSSSRIQCFKNGDFNVKRQGVVCYAWFVWRKGFKGNTTLKWFN